MKFSFGGGGRDSQGLRDHPCIAVVGLGSGYAWSRSKVSISSLPYNKKTTSARPNIPDKFQASDSTTP